MKNSEIKSLSNEELQEKIVATQQSYHSLKFTHAVAPIENPMEIRKMRKLIASMKTELHNRTLALVAQKIDAGEVTRENARDFLSAQNLPTPFNLAKTNKMLEKAGK